LQRVRPFIGREPGLSALSELLGGDEALDRLPARDRWRGQVRARPHVPRPRARRLYLGFADGYLYVGAPGWYDNNSGELSVTVDMRRR
jgi:hypothetical protein